VANGLGMNFKKQLEIMKKVLLVAVATLGLLSCEPEMCEDCYTYTYSDGTIEWVCIEYDCSDY